MSHERSIRLLSLPFANQPAINSRRIYFRRVNPPPPRLFAVLPLLPSSRSRYLLPILPARIWRLSARRCLWVEGWKRRRHRGLCSSYTSILCPRGQGQSSAGCTDFPNFSDSHVKRDRLGRVFRAGWVGASCVAFPTGPSVRSDESCQFTIFCVRMSLA